MNGLFDVVVVEESDRAAKLSGELHTRMPIVTADW